MTADEQHTSPPPVREWSLARLFRRWLTLATFVPVLVASVVGMAFLERSLERELRALLEEEISEAGLRLRTSAPSDFAGIAAILAADHPSVRMAWRLSRGLTLLGEYGDIGILRNDAPGLGITNRTTQLAEGLLSKTVELDDDLRLGLILDATEYFDWHGRYRMIALLVLVLSGIVALVAGGALARRVSGILQVVADGVAPGPPSKNSSPRVDGAPIEIKAIAMQLHELLAKTQEQSEEARTFTMSLAHELRSPVQNLIGQAEVALMAAQDIETYRSVLSSQLEELAQFGDSIDNVLTLCTHSLQAQGSIEEFDLGEEASIRLTREQTRGRLNDVTVATVTAGDTRIRGDREMILRGLRNVVANAVEWSPHGARVEVRISGEGDMIRITVDDSGPGLPSELRERVFDPFFQGPKPLNRRIGYGLGLAMTKRAADTHGGKVIIGESPSGGARFELSFGKNSRNSQPGSTA